MNILLLNPYTGAIEMSPPLGLRYISGMLKHRGFKNIVGVDLHVDTMSKFESEVTKADVIGIHTVSKIFPEVVKLAQKAKMLNPQIKVVIGGPHATLCPEEVISAEPIDFVVCGEGEYTFLDLVDALERSKNLSEDLSNIKGIWHKSDGEIKENPSRGWVKNLDELPFPDFELFDVRKYVPAWRLYKSATMIASRSCPYSCTTCQPALREIIGPYRQRSVENTLSEIRFLMSKYKVRCISFNDNTFTVNRKWVIEFCNEVIRQKLNFIWSCAGTIMAVDKELMGLMKEAGCRRISFGVESGSQYVLDNILHKRHSVERAREVMREASEVKLRTHCWFMIGIPGETKEQIWQTVELAKTINATSVMFSVVQPQVHTVIEKTGREKGWLSPYQLSDIEKLGLYPFSSFETDEWLGRSSLFKTDEWGPEFIEEVKQKIVDDFKKMGWARDGFTFSNIKKKAEDNLILYLGVEVLAFLKDFDFIHIKLALKAIKYKVLTKFV